MIRREGSAAEDSAGRWVLISQVDHARLAGQLAEHWGANGFAAIEPREALLWAIHHHDDGWRNWEQAPEVDPQSGEPRSFIEMELVDSLAIWRASIDEAALAGNLQGYLVAGHFCALARRSAAWRSGQPDWPLVEEFLPHYETLGSAWRAAWEGEDPVNNTRQVAELALAQLQFFDTLSLWFCCSLAEGPETAKTAAGPILTLVPRDPRRIELSPWPLTVASLAVEVAGRAVPVARYQNNAELAAAPAQPVVLRWQLAQARENR